jgi:hypothetical protein
MASSTSHKPGDPEPDIDAKIEVVLDETAAPGNVLPVLADLLITLSSESESETGQAPPSGPAATEGSPPGEGQKPPRTEN